MQRRVVEDRVVLRGAGGHEIGSNLILPDAVVKFPNGVLRIMSFRIFREENPIMLISVRDGRALGLDMPQDILFRDNESPDDSPDDPPDESPDEHAGSEHDPMPSSREIKKVNTEDAPVCMNSALKKKKKNRRGLEGT